MAKDARAGSNAGPFFMACGRFRQCCLDVLQKVCFHIVFSVSYLRVLSGWQARRCSLFFAKGVDEGEARAYSSPPQLTQRTKQRKRN
ncbi:hypothetical protein, partial [Chromobacterium sinusclupearum]|uniref:hypothetical protein n=1 Tax=Chromobacterium sinusclupearum TaxID=2077146 RepID=UPI001E358A4A